MPMVGDTPVKIRVEVKLTEGADSDDVTLSIPLGDVLEDVDDETLLKLVEENAGIEFIREFVENKGG